MTAPSTLGGSLARALAIAVAAGMGLFAVAQGVTWYISQSGEECAPGVPEESAAEIVEHAVLSLVISAPVGVALALALGRRLSLPTTARLDELIGSARRMTGDRLDERLPVGATGDPLDRLSEAINGLLARVERGVAAQQQFAADASHELRTPLTVISTKLEVARRKPRDAAHWASELGAEILPTGIDGHIRNFGSRKHYDHASPIYREHSRRITREIAGRYGQHPAVEGWQTDNEWGCHSTIRSYGGASVVAFREWLERKYGTLDALNDAWGNVFWSQEYTDWSQIDPPFNMPTDKNPSHVLDFDRFASDAVAEFQAEQIAIIRELSPGRWITHNYMMHFNEFDLLILPRNQKQTDWLTVATRTDGSEWRLPLLYVTGAQPGPTLVVTAGKEAMTAPKIPEYTTEVPMEPL